MIKLTPEDYKYSFKKFVKSKDYDDLITILEFNIAEKTEAIASEPNVNNLIRHKHELALYITMRNNFNYYHENLDQI